MTVLTDSGTRIETLELCGQSTPFEYKGWIHFHLAINGKKVEPFQIMKGVYERERAEMQESEFWEMRVADAQETQRALENMRVA